MPLESLAEFLTEQGVYQRISGTVTDEAQDADLEEQEQVLKV